MGFQIPDQLGGRLVSFLELKSQHVRTVCLILRTILSSLRVLFVVLHLRQFRFGEVGATVVRDLYGLQMELFKDWRQVAFYLASLAATAVHVWFGWSKTILKMDITKEQRKPFETLGHLLVWPLFLGFAACPLYCYSSQLGNAVVSHGNEL